MTDETYLGDGLYASFDGDMFKLRAPRGHVDHWVALEPSVLAAFDAYRREVMTAIAMRQVTDALGKFKFAEDE